MKDWGALPSSYFLFTVRALPLNWFYFSRAEHLYFVFPYNEGFRAFTLKFFPNKRTIHKWFIPKNSSTRELPPTALLDANSLLYLHFTLAILSCILPFRSSPLALACAAADLYFSSLCCNASSTVFGSCREAWNKKDNEKLRHSDFKTYKLPFSYPSLPPAETKLLLKILIYNSSKGSLWIFYFHYWSITKIKMGSVANKI